MFPGFSNSICFCYECWENFMKSLVACPSNLEICCGCNLIDLISFKWVSLFTYWSFFFEIKGLMKRWSRILPSLFHPLSRPPCFLRWQRRYVMSHFCKFGFMWRCRTLQSWSVFKLPLAAWAQLVYFGWELLSNLITLCIWATRKTQRSNNWLPRLPLL